MVKTPVHLQPDYEPKLQKEQPPHWIFLLLLIVVAGVIFLSKEKDFAQKDDQGNVRISPLRKAELQKALDELDNGEQYALLAAINGWYPCYSCPDTTAILLLTGEVWKYGVTRKGEKGRYGNSLADRHLIYQVQFRGIYGDCLKEERHKIFYYPELPENAKRIKWLIRPPGNKRDD